ncbi:MAG: winged helix-turn-helix transcriptional regulator [Candidatus Nanoarchaeia archaeon]|nr:winged helix-turn-helix transcriptional regulator [Candidatus Nanoarchaeia archaeon]
MKDNNESRILRFLLRNNARPGFNINSIARNIGISVGSAFKILKELEKSGMASVERLGNACFYSLNLANEEAAKRCELLLLEEKRDLTGHAKIYAEDIQKFENAELIVMFGSVLRKKDFNDVDILFVTDKAREASSFCLEISKVRAKPVVPMLLKKTDAVRELRERKEVMQTIIREGIVLRGEQVFIEIIKNGRV